MASNNGRGPVNQTRFTDTIANGDSIQAILRKQDEMLAALNRANARAVISSYVNSFDAFSLSQRGDVREYIVQLIVGDYVQDTSAIAGTVPGLAGTTLNVTTGQGVRFLAGDIIEIVGDSGTELNRISSISTDALTLEFGVRAVYAVGNAVHPVNVNSLIAFEAPIVVDLQN